MENATTSYCEDGILPTGSAMLNSEVSRYQDVSRYRKNARYSGETHRIQAEKERLSKAFRRASQPHTPSRRQEDTLSENADYYYDPTPRPRVAHPDVSQPTADQEQDLTRYSVITARNPRNWLRFGSMALIIAACIGLIIFISCRALTSEDTASLGGAFSAPDTSPRSTPASEWKQGTIPSLYQTDPAWSQTPYAGSTIGVAGCGPTCLSMVAISLTGRQDLDPTSMAAFSEYRGYVMDGLTSWELMTTGASYLGLYGESIPADPATIQRLLSQGYPIIASVTPGDFTNEGHFIVLAGLASDGNSIVVHDPNSPERSKRTWDLDTILSQTANLWAFSVA